MIKCLRIFLACFGIFTASYMLTSKAEKVLTKKVNKLVTVLTDEKKH